mgnify:CR=1 FL=1
MGKNKVKVTGFRIRNQEILEKIDIIAGRNNRKRNQEVNHILESYVENYENKYGEIIVD